MGQFSLNTEEVFDFTKKATFKMNEGAARQSFNLKSLNKFKHAIPKVKQMPQKEIFVLNQKQTTIPERHDCTEVSDEDDENKYSSAGQKQIKHSMDMLSNRKSNEKAIIQSGNISILNQTDRSIDDYHHNRNQRSMIT